MSQPPSSQPPGWFERLGVRYFRALSEGHRRREQARGAPGRQGARGAAELADQDSRRAVRRVSLFGMTIALLIGGISAGGTVLSDLLFGEECCRVFLSTSCLTKYGWVAAVTLALTLVEFAVLFWVSIRVVFAIARITGHSTLEESDAMAGELPGLLARAALEIPDPVRHLFGIDPLRRVSKKKLVAIGLLYKLKVMFSNVLAKLLLRRVLGKSALRVSADWVAVLITGLWNAIVVFKVAREARLRLFGNLLARHIVKHGISEEKLAALSQEARLGCLQAVGNSVVLTQNYHPNMLILLSRLSEALRFDGRATLDDWPSFLKTLTAVTPRERYFILDLLAIAAAFDGRLSRLERATLGEAFGEHSAAYFRRILRLRDLLWQGRLQAARRECEVDFEPG